MKIYNIRRYEEPSMSFETKFYSSEYEWSFPATDKLSEIVQRIEGYYPNVTLQYSSGGFNVLSEGSHIGTIKPTYANNNKITNLHKLFANG